MDAETAAVGECYKFGELPSYGTATSSRLISLIGPDRDLFLRGRRCEFQGLGIGAFAYYRRVVENQKNRIIGKIIAVAKAVGASSEITTALKLALEENQFTKAMEVTKDAIPESLRINGQNPLTLLHSALSEGLHALDDDTCLTYAHAIRLVLAELSERMAQILKDNNELNEAVSILVKKRS
jgi:hypothetical protein